MRSLIRGKQVYDGFLGQPDGYCRPSCVQFLNPPFPSRVLMLKNNFSRCALLLEDRATFYALYFVISHIRPIRGAVANLPRGRSGRVATSSVMPRARQMYPAVTTDLFVENGHELLSIKKEDEMREVLELNSL